MWNQQEFIFGLKLNKNPPFLLKANHLCLSKEVKSGGKMDCREQTKTSTNQFPQKEVSKDPFPLFY